ncbi:FAD-dependent monooxygenase [Microbispora rosea]|uniref:FAD-dependent monooxygenase n=1 Tax=Microbispora rosea TaxID=58117 RepID=UPI0037C8362A
MREAEHVPVLIVGGSVSGLSTAAFLARQGVACRLVERRGRPAWHPRMSDVGPRSMELFRSLGIEERLRALDEGRESVIIRVDRLAGREIERLSMGGPEEYGGLTPTGQVWCDQDQLEPVLRARAEELGADIRFGVELVGFTQDEAGVRAVVRDTAGGGEHTVTASYLVACDGAQSPVREHLGITCDGPGVLSHQAGILFRADLSSALRGRSFVLCLVDDLVDSATGDRLNILLERNLGRWTLSVPCDAARGEGAADFTRERCVDLVRRAVGQDDLSVEVLGTDVWPMRALLAERYRSGRVFLVGDAAKVLPPTGGFGGNSCIEDAHNLAWKLAAALDGTASPGLLDSYEAERRPVAQLLLRESVARAGLFLAGAAQGGSRQPGDGPSKAGVVLGYRYNSGALIPDPGPADPAPVEDPRRPSGRPGTRAPHVVVERHGRTLSTIDLFGPGFVLLTGSRGAAWQRAAAEVAGDLGIDLTAYRVTPPRPSASAGRAAGDAVLLDVEDRWTGAYGVGDGGAVLVRPDGFIAWRRPAEEDRPGDALRDAIVRLLRPSGAPSTAGAPPRTHTVTADASATAPAAS